MEKAKEGSKEMEQKPSMIPPPPPPPPPSLLSTEEVILKLKCNAGKYEHYKQYKAMYSSVLEGITTDPAMMLIPLDDHMVHRGHGVFDTALIIEGYLYELDAHVDRLLKSAKMARITSPFSKETLKNILLETVSASQSRNGLLRYWLSAGPGGFDLSSKECIRSAFYAMVIVSNDKQQESYGSRRVITSSIPMKPTRFATMKSVNYLPNALSQLEAEDKGAFAGIWVDDKEYVAEGPNTNVAFVNKDGELHMPPFDNILSGCTAKRILALARQMLEVSGNCCPLKGIKEGPISVKEGKNAAEMMLIGSGLPILPIIQWDEQMIGNGQPGPITVALRSLLQEDMLHGPHTCREPVPYRNSERV